MSKLLTIRDPSLRVEIEGLWREILQLKAQGSAMGVSQALLLYMGGQAEASGFVIRHPFDSLSLRVVGGTADGTSPMISLEPEGGTGRVIDTNISGCYLTAGGTWTSTSSASRKIFLPLGWSLEEHLGKVQALGVGPFEYKLKDKDEGSGEKHFGPSAEQFSELFGIGDGKGIAAMDLASVALIAVQSLTSKMESLEAEVTRLKALVETKENGAPG
jgi:uncharacterized small protein (DUF1192 family)